MPTPADSSADTAATNRPPAAPDTIVLIHGFWVTPRTWERWIPYYEARGYRVLATAYPGLEAEVEALNRDPSPIERLTVPRIVDHLERVVRGLESPPILMGHSAPAPRTTSCRRRCSAPTRSTTSRARSRR